MESGNPLEKFCAALLNGTPAIEFAAASYGPAGKVERVEPGRMPVKGGEDLARVVPWLRGRNANGAAIWARPAAQVQAHPWVFLDDLPLAMAQRTAAKYAALVVETSPGNAQVWIRAARDLSREQRQDVSRALAGLIGADPHAIAEPRWGRAPGFRSGKSGRPWTRLIADSSTQDVLFDPTPYLSAPAPSPPNGGRVVLSPGSGSRSDRAEGADESAREFAYAIHALRAGTASERVVERVMAHALSRGKRDTVEACRRYAEKTVEKARNAL